MSEPSPRARILAECDRKLANYRAALDAGTDPKIVTEWIAQVQAEKSLAEAYDSFVDQFETSEGGSIHVGAEVHEEAMEDDELEQEQIVKQKRS